MLYTFNLSDNNLLLNVSSKNLLYTSVYFSLDFREILYMTLQAYIFTICVFTPEILTKK
jgi:hypothetical protein